MPKQLTETTKDMVVQMFNDGKSQNDIANRLDISYSSVTRILQEKGLKQTNSTNEQNTSVLSGIKNKLDDLMYEIEWLKDNMKDRTIEFKDLPDFRDENGTFKSDVLKININNRRVFVHHIKDRGTSKERWETCSIEPVVIEAIWTEMKLRGWSWYK